MDAWRDERDFYATDLSGEQNCLQREQAEAPLLLGMSSTGNVSADAVSPVTSYVSLFLLMLVFFAVLFSIASFQQARSRAILSSLDEAFAHLPSRLGLIATQNAALEEAGPEVTQNLLSLFKAFSTPVVFTGKSGDYAIDVALQTDKLFVPQSDRLQEPARHMLDRFAVFLQHPLDGERPQLTLRAGTGSQTAEETPTVTLAIARVGEIAKYLFDRGAPPQSLAVTLDAAVGERMIVATIAPQPVTAGGERN